MKLVTAFKKARFIDFLIIVFCLGLMAIFRGSFGVVFLGFVCIVFTILRKIDLRKHVVIRRTLMACLLTVGVSFLIIESFVISEMGANEANISGIDYVVVLGCGLKGYDLSTTLRQRLDTSLNYVSNQKNIPIIVSGGQGPGEHVSEAAAMSDYLISKGISKDRIVLESKSTSTIENLLFSKSILHEKGIMDPKIIMITSDYHMFRAKLIARKLGFVTYGISSKSPVNLKPINMIREYFAMIKTIVQLSV